MLVYSFGCSYETADIEFAFTLSQALDKGNNLAHHLIQSFEPGEVSFEKAHEIGKQLADAVTKRSRYSSKIRVPCFIVISPRSRFFRTYRDLQVRCNSFLLWTER